MSTQTMVLVLAGALVVGVGVYVMTRPPEGSAAPAPDPRLGQIPGAADAGQAERMAWVNAVGQAFQFGGAVAGAVQRNATGPSSVPTQQQSAWAGDLASTGGTMFGGASKGYA